MLTSRGRRNAWVACALILCTALLIRPTIAWAHARLKKSEPSANATMTSPPTAIRLWFTEEPELALTKVTLSDSSGTMIETGTPVHDVDGALSVRVPISGSLGAGLFTVAWTTAAMDGHPSSGKFRFRVTVSSVVGAPAVGAPIVTPTPLTARPVAVPPADDTGASALTPPYVAARALSFAALLAIIGAVAFRVAVLPRTAGFDALMAAEVEASVATRAAMFAGLFLIVGLVRLYLQNRMMTGDAGVDAAHMRTMSMETHWGAVWRMQFGAAIAAAIGFLVARRRVALGWALAACASVVLATTTALGGHAGSAERLHVLSVLADTLHVVGAAGWLGSLLWLAIVGLPVVQSSGEAGARRVAVLVRAFSPAALCFAGLLVVAGLASAWLRLGAVNALWSTAYGQTLLVKLAVVGGVGGIGFYNWQRVRPSLGTEAASARLQRSATIELGVGLLVIVVTAILVAMPAPAMPAPAMPAPAMRAPAMPARASAGGYATR